MAGVECFESMFMADPETGSICGDGGGCLQATLRDHKRLATTEPRTFCSTMMYWKEMLRVCVVLARSTLQWAMFCLSRKHVHA